jgi:uncharacterized protein YjcR
VVRVRYRDPDWLRGKLENGATHREIADECGVAQPTISEWVVRHGLAERDDRTEEYKDESWMRERIGEGLTHAEIGEICGVSKSTITRWKDRHGLSAESDGDDDPAVYRPRGAPSEFRYDAEDREEPAEYRWPDCMDEHDPTDDAEAGGPAGGGNKYAEMFVEMTGREVITETGP